MNGTRNLLIGLVTVVAMPVFAETKTGAFPPAKTASRRSPGKTPILNKRLPPRESIFLVCRLRRQSELWDLKTRSAATHWPARATMLLNRRLSALSRSDANRFLDRKNEYPAIVDAPCSRLVNNGSNRAPNTTVGNHDLKLKLRINSLKYSPPPEMEV